MFLLSHTLSLSSHTESSYSVENPSHVLCMRQLFPHSPRGKSVPWAWSPYEDEGHNEGDMRPKQVNPIPHHDFPAFRKDHYFPPLHLFI